MEYSVKGKRNALFLNYKNSVGILFFGVLLLLSFQASAALINSSFENGFDDWTTSGDPYIVTDAGSGRTRDSYQTYNGWEGADVWFSNLPSDGSKYAVFGSAGNESVGSITSSLWTAENQFISFWHAGNNSSGVTESSRAFAAILDESGNELARVVATSMNDSQWREFTLDLQTIGLAAGDQFQFYYEDGDSWSVIDNISASGPQLANAEVPEPSSVALMALALMGFGVLKRKN